MQRLRRRCRGRATRPGHVAAARRRRCSGPHSGPSTARGRLSLTWAGQMQCWAMGRATLYAGIEKAGCGRIPTAMARAKGSGLARAGVRERACGVESASAGAKLELDGIAWVDELTTGHLRKAFPHLRAKGT